MMVKAATMGREHRPVGPAECLWGGVQQGGWDPGCRCREVSVSGGPSCGGDGGRGRKGYASGVAVVRCVMTRSLPLFMPPPQ